MKVTKRQLRRLVNEALNHDEAIMDDDVIQMVEDIAERVANVWSNEAGKHGQAQSVNWETALERASAALEDRIFDAIRLTERDFENGEFDSARMG